MASGEYILILLATDYPTDDSGSAAGTTALEYYQLTVSAAFGIKNVRMLAKGTDTIRDRVVKLIYLNQT